MFELLGIQNKGIILIVIGMFISIGVVVRISTSKINELLAYTFVVPQFFQRFIFGKCTI